MIRLLAWLVGHLHHGVPRCTACPRRAAHMAYGLAWCTLHAPGWVR